MHPHLAYDAKEAHAIAKSESLILGKTPRKVNIYTKEGGYPAEIAGASLIEAVTGRVVSLDPSKGNPRFMVALHHPNDGSVFVDQYFGGKAQATLEYIH